MPLLISRLHEGNLTNYFFPVVNKSVSKAHRETDANSLKTDVKSLKKSFLSQHMCKYSAAQVCLYLQIQHQEHLFYTICQHDII